MRSDSTDFPWTSAVTLMGRGMARRRLRAKIFQTLLFREGEIVPCSLSGNQSVWRPLWLVSACHFVVSAQKNREPSFPMCAPSFAQRPTGL